MAFNSILFKQKKDAVLDDDREMPGFFEDLNLDQVIQTITVAKDEYHLKPYFYTPLRDSDSIKYRHEVMKDLENRRVFDIIREFSNNMRSMREELKQAEKLYYPFQKHSLLLDAVDIYCDAVVGLLEQLSLADLKSRGLLWFREYLRKYTSSQGFITLRRDAKIIKNDFSKIQYCIHIKGSTVRVRKYEGEVDYSQKVLDTFEKFKIGAVKDYRVEIKEYLSMNHVEALILEQVSNLYPEVFAALGNFVLNNYDFTDPTIVVFDREIQFYVAYIEYMEIFKRLGLKFCYPRIGSSKEIYCEDGYDIALAYSLYTSKQTVICNDFFLKGNERIIIVSGPNQGGKTTFARMFGQLHYLANLGCPIPGRRARLLLFDQIFTHFEKEEKNNNLRGKLEDDLLRIRNILDRATSDSIIIMNEIFNSTTVSDALILSKNVIEKIMNLDALCVYVTFIYELASLGEKTVSMVSTVVPENPTMRTFKIIRKPADGLAFAVTIAEKYGLTHSKIKERIKPS